MSTSNFKNADSILSVTLRKNHFSEEENSFIMQQNPENLIKLGLYYEQYEKIIQNISIKISRLKSNDKI